MQVQALPPSRIQAQERCGKDRNRSREGRHIKENWRRKAEAYFRKQIQYYLSYLGPLVTYEVFLKWKEDRARRKEADAKKKKEEEEKKTKNKGLLRTGRELFTYDPTLFVDDEEAAAEYEQEEIIEQE